MKHKILLAMLLFLVMSPIMAKDFAYSETLYGANLSHTDMTGVTSYVTKSFAFYHDEIVSGNFFAKLDDTLVCGLAVPVNTTVPDVFKITISSCSRRDDLTVVMMLRHDLVLDQYVIPIVGTRPRILFSPYMIHTTDEYIENGGMTVQQLP